MTGVSLETKADAKGVPPSRLLGLDNAVFTRMGSIAKRNGYEALGTRALGAPLGGGYSGARALAARGPELVLFTEDRCYSYVEGSEAWSDVGVVQSVMQSDRPIAKTAATQISGDYAAVSGIAVAAWEDSRGGVWWCALEDDGGRIVQAVQQASATGSRPRCVRVGDRLAVLWVEASANQVKIIIVDPGEPHSFNASVFPRILISDLDATNPSYDVAYVGTEGAARGNAACIAWCATSGIRAGWIDPSGAIGSPGNGGWGSPCTFAASTGSTYGPTIVPSPWTVDQWFVAWGRGPAPDAGSKLGLVNGASAPVATLGTVDLGLAGGDAIALAMSRTDGVGEVRVWVEDRATPRRNSTVTQLVYDGVGVSTVGTYRHACLASKGFTDVKSNGDATALVTLVYDVPIFGVYLTMRSDGVVVARTLPGIAGDSPDAPHLPSVVTDGRVHRWCAIAKTQLDGIDGDRFTEAGLRLVTLDFDSANSHQTVHAGQSLYMGGACPQVYDGQGWVEHNFHYGIDWESHETLATQAVNANGQLTVTGTYGYVFVPEFTLANGEIVYGPPSKPLEVELAGSNNQVTLAIPTIGITRMTGLSYLGGQQRAEARIGVFRTVAGDASAYYRVSNREPPMGGGAGSPANLYVENSPGVDSIVFIDRMSDEALLRQEPLYTNGGIFENDPIPGSGILAGGKGRLFSVHPSDGNLVLFGQERAEGRAMEMPDGLQFRVDDAGGPITALGVMDDALVIFKRNQIYFVGGPGPLANPEAGGGFSAPALITSDVGCTAAKSIASTPQGVVFQSSKGVYLLDRGRQVSYVGAPVEAFNGQAVTRAALVDDTTQIRFLTDDGRTLLYDYLFGQWATWTNHQGRDAVIVGGRYHYLRTDGRVFREEPGRYDDAGNRYPLRIETAWIRLTDHLQGFQRIYHLMAIGTWRSPHTLRLQYRTDYDPHWSPPMEFDAMSAGGTVYGEGDYGDGPYGGQSPTLYQWRWHLGRKGQAIQLRFVDVEAHDNYGPAFELVELAITGGVKGPLVKVPAARSA